MPSDFEKNYLFGICMILFKMSSTVEQFFFFLIHVIYFGALR